MSCSSLTVLELKPLLPEFLQDYAVPFWQLTHSLHPLVEGTYRALFGWNASRRSSCLLKLPGSAKSRALVLIGCRWIPREGKARARCSTRASLIGGRHAAFRALRDSMAADACAVSFVQWSRMRTRVIDDDCCRDDLSVSSSTIAFSRHARSMAAAPASAQMVLVLWPKTE